MENKELEKNLDRIAQYDEELSKNILMTDIDKANISLAQNPNGEYNILYNDCFLHSEENIEAETRQILSTIGERNNSNVLRIVYGLGLGYLADKVSELSGKIIIYEPNLEILKFVFSIATIDAIFKNNVFVCADKTQLSELVLEHSNCDTKITFNYLPAYSYLFNDDIEETKKLVIIAKSGHNTTKNTLFAKSPRAIKNTFLNLKNILNNPHINQLEGIYKGKTALCLSAGPSLRENIEIIRDNQDKFIIFAVNPTIKLLSQYGIKPDFIVDIETVNNFVQFSTIDPKEHYFIMEAFANNLVYNQKTKKTFNYISAVNFANSWLVDCMKLPDNLETLGTVSYTTLNSAYLMGFKKIILCGQDLAYKDGKCYAQGSQFEELECVFDKDKNKYVIKARDFEKYLQSINSSPANAKKYIEFLNNNLYTVISQDGKKLPTQSGYAVFISWFENFAKKIKAQNPDIELINASIGGALIKGYDNISLNDIVPTLEPIEKLDLSEYKPNYDTEQIKLRIKLLKEKLVLYKKVLDELLALSNKILREIKIKKTLTMNILKAIQKQDNLISELASAKNDKDLRPIVFFSLCKYVDVLTPDCFDNPQKGIATLEKLIAISTEADKIYEVVLNNLANC